MNRENEFMEFEEFLNYYRTELGVKKTKKSQEKLITFLRASNEYRGNIVGKNGEFKISKELIYKQAQMYKEGMSCGEALEMLSQYKYSKDMNITKEQLLNKTSVYNLPLVNLKETYAPRKRIREIINAISEVREKGCITTKRFQELLNEEFTGINFDRRNVYLVELTDKYRDEIITPKHLGNFFANANIYPKETVKKIVQELKVVIEKEAVRLVNLTYEDYLKLSRKEFETDYIEITLNDLMSLFGWSRNTCNFTTINEHFSKTNVKFIWINTVKRFYVSKNEYNEQVNFIENLKRDYIKITDITETHVQAGNLKTNKIPYIKFKNAHYIKKEDKDYLVNKLIKARAIRETDTIFDRFKLSFDYMDDKSKGKFPNFNNIFLDYARYVSKNNTVMAKATMMFSVYETILGYMKKDFDKMNKKERYELLMKAIYKYGDSHAFKLNVIQFNNYLKTQLKYSVNDIVNTAIYTPSESYDAEAFIKLLTKLIEIIADKDELKKIYRNWKLSTAIAYLFMHYTLAWRRMDLIEHLPTTDLRYIDGINDAESFIKWLEAGNEISGKKAFEICNNLEVITDRLRKTANKNNQDLFCVISNELSQSIATLLCICKANKQIYFEKTSQAKRLKNANVFHEPSTKPKNMRKLIIEAFGIDINEILNGDFDNIKMNKGFLNLVRDKAEELGIAYSYYFAQISRGHTPTDGCLAETTKIYLEKNISKASIRAFALGTMGSVQHIMLELLDSKYNNLDYLKQIEYVNELNITPYTLEENISKITQKISSMKKEIDTYFRKGGDFKELLNKFLFEQDVYGIERGTKCLLKITRDEEGIARIMACGNNERKRNKIKCPRNRSTCIGCDYLIALRYFIYEFNKKMNELLKEMESCETELDEEICIDTFNEVYVPVINDMAQVIGKEVDYIYDRKKTARIMWGE